MNTLLVAVGSAGDVHPFVGLGAALAGRGHRVTVITNGYFERLVRAAGLEFAAFATADEYRSMIAHPHVWSRFRGFVAAARLGILPALEPIYEAIRQLHVPGETVLAASTLGLGALLAQEKLGVPVATVHLSPAVFRSDFENPVLPGMFLPEWLPRALKRWQYWLADAAVIDRVLVPPLNEYRRRLKLAPLAGGVFAEWIHSPRSVIGMFPPWYAAPQPDWPPQTALTGFPLYDEQGISDAQRELAEWVTAGAPPLVFTPGSAMVFGQSFFEAAVEACQLLGRRGLLLTRFSEQVPHELPARVRHEEFIPLGWLLRRSAALVHHGGIGTLSQGLAAGVPQLVMPMSFDQPDNAARVARLGVGAAIPRRRFRGPAVAAALERLLTSPEVRADCQTVAARFQKARPLEAAADVVEGLIHEGARRLGVA